MYIRTSVSDRHHSRGTQNNKQTTKHTKNKATKTTATKHNPNQQEQIEKKYLYIYI